MYKDLGIGNDLALSGKLILQNLHAVQSRNNVPKSRLLQEEGTPGNVLLPVVFLLENSLLFSQEIIIFPSVVWLDWNCQNALVAQWIEQ